MSKNANISEEEQELLNEFNNGELKQIDNVESEIAKTIIAAKKHLRKKDILNQLEIYLNQTII